MTHQEDASREEQYELDVAMTQLQYDWRRLRNTHETFLRIFKNEMKAVIEASENLLPDVAPNTISCEWLTVSLLSGRCTWKELHVPLTVTEMKIVSCLTRRPDQIYGRDYLMEAFLEEGDSDRLVDSHIKRIRRKFEAVDEKFNQIYTVYGAGYRWNL